MTDPSNLPIGFQGDENQVGDNVYREGGHNRDVSDITRTNDIADFVDWSAQMGYNLTSNPDDINTLINEYITNPALEGTIPTGLEEFLVEYGDYVGQAIGALSNVPMGGTIGQVIASYFVDNYWMDHQWANPADTDAFPEGALDEFWTEIDLQNPDTWGAEQSPIGAPPPLQGTPLFGQGGPWYADGNGGATFDRSGASGTSADQWGGDATWHGEVTDDGTPTGSGWVCGTNGECVWVKSN